MVTGCKLSIENQSQIQFWKKSIVAKIPYEFWKIKFTCMYSLVLCICKSNFVLLLLKFRRIIIKTYIFLNVYQWDTLTNTSVEISIYGERGSDRHQCWFTSVTTLLALNEWIFCLEISESPVPIFFSIIP